MVLQRWQTVLLFISLVLISIFSVSNYGTLEMADGGQLSIMASENTGYWLYNLAIVLILLISIFQFKTPGWQKTFIVIALLMMVGTAIWGCLYLNNLTMSGGAMHLNISWILLIVAFGLSLVSFFLICSDQRKLKAADRIR